ncbi:MAG: CHAT domain-containing protein [Bacteroidia bacterium]
MEKGKAMLLHKNAALGNLSRAVAVKTKADSLQQQIAQLRIKSKGKDEPEAAQKLLAQLEVEADLLGAGLKNDPAATAVLLRESAPRLMGQLQQQVLARPGRALVHFFVAEKAIYSLYVQKDKVAFNKTELDSLLNQSLETFRKSVSEVPDSRDAEVAFHSCRKHAYLIYSRLLQPLFRQYPEATHITIIPHGQLSTIPFESLITDPAEEADSYQELPYLLRTKTISYAYSVTSLLNHSRGQIGHGALAIAPSFAREGSPGDRSPDEVVRGNLTKLEWTTEEARKVHALYGGKLLLGDRASEGLFKENLGQFGIIHIASHALLHEEEPTLSRIFFSISDDSSEDGSLFLEEIFGMDFHDKIICLSACNTAWGKLTRSDGLLSLARGFHYAGSPSLMATLWQAHDRSSFLISTRFHQELNNGNPLDDAMRQAKISYLENADALKGHPYYWAHMLVIGETQIRPGKSGYPDPIYAGLIFMLIAGIGFIQIYRLHETG